MRVVLIERKNPLNVWFWASLFGKEITDEQIIEGEKNLTFSEINLISHFHSITAYETAQNLLKAAETINPEEYVHVSVFDFNFLS